MMNRRATGAIRRRVRSALGRAVAAGVAGGIPLSWTGYLGVLPETVQEYFGRHGGRQWESSYETIHPPAVATNALPCNVLSRNELPAERLPDCLIYWYRDLLPSFVAACS